MTEHEDFKNPLCPNCHSPATRSGNEITCESCDAVFTITKKEGAKVKQLGPIEDLQKRVKRLESLIPGDEPGDEPEPEPEPDKDNSLL
ncbi:MAG: hypothetical protein WAV28_07055 [Sedimentisphaerales bacterium]